jgi:hypothetical protein
VRTQPRDTFLLDVCFWSGLSFVPLGASANSIPVALAGMFLTSCALVALFSDATRPAVDEDDA